MSDADATVFGVYHAHMSKGRDVLVTVALPADEWERLRPGLGTHPTRAGKISLALTSGFAAATLHKLLRKADDAPAPGAEEPYNFGQAVMTIAHLTVRMALLTDAANGSTSEVAAAIAREARDDAARDLATAAGDFNATLRAAVAGARPC